MVKAPEGSGMCARLASKSMLPTLLSTIGVVCVVIGGAIEIVAAMIEIVVVEVVAIDDGCAMGDVGVVVVDYPVAMPIASPVMPAPSKSPEEADSKSNPERDCRPSQKDPWYGIPAWICDDRVAVHEPRIVRGHVNHFRIRGFDDDCVPLRCYLFLFIAI